jgi:hypothetical protein
MVGLRAKPPGEFGQEAKHSQDESRSGPIRSFTTGTHDATQFIRVDGFEQLG